jgi:hypothetical protein
VLPNCDYTTISVGKAFVTLSLTGERQGNVFFSISIGASIGLPVSVFDGIIDDPFLDPKRFLRGSSSNVHAGLFFGLGRTYSHNTGWSNEGGLEVAIGANLISFALIQFHPDGRIELFPY